MHSRPKLGLRGVSAWSWREACSLPSEVGKPLGRDGPRGHLAAQAQRDPWTLPRLGGHGAVFPPGAGQPGTRRPVSVLPWEALPRGQKASVLMVSSCVSNATEFQTPGRSGCGQPRTVPPHRSRAPPLPHPLLLRALERPGFGDSQGTPPTPPARGGETAGVGRPGFKPQFRCSPPLQLWVG